jgi:multidrug resistance efflux pump
MQTFQRVPPQPIERPKPPGGRRTRRTSKLLMLAAPVLLLGSSTWLMLPAGHAHRSDLLTQPVHFDKLCMTYAEHGVLAAAVNSDIICRVKARSHGSTVASTIKWVIEDGSPVRKDDVVVLLDDSALQEDLKTQHVAVLNAANDWVLAEQNRTIVQTQSQADIQSARVTLELAEVDYKKYVLGDYVETHKDVEGRLAQAQSDMEMSRERVSWAERMLRKGFSTFNQVRSEHSQLQSCEVALDKVSEEKRVLEQFARKRTQTELEANLAEARRAVERVKHVAQAKEVQAESERLTKLSIYEREKHRYRDLEEQIGDCTLRSPGDGIVVYYASEQSRSGSGAQQGVVAQGEPVREGQRLMQIPDLRHMIVETKLHESALFHVHTEIRRPTGFTHAVQAGLLASPSVLQGLTTDAAFLDMRDRFHDQDERVQRSGDAALIHIHAFPDLLWHGHVRQIANVPLMIDWRMTDTKVYQTVVTIDEPPQNLKPGMTAAVTIFPESALDHVLTVPVEALVEPVKRGEANKCFVLTEEGPEARAVVLGANNDTVAQVKDGIHEGEEIVLNPEALADKSRAMIGP